ncbi:MAG: glutathione S-transferase family protein [Proteobacteria bacterium]|nr:glutathione S-transferase family protein [Pseudomonadota bacterium]
MGVMIDGRWHGDKNDFPRKDGHFVRQSSSFRNWITADGAPGPSGEGGFPAEAGRYHLYVSLACPWACRVLILRKLKGLEDTITVSVVDPKMDEEGWVFGDASGDTPGANPDTVNGFDRLYEVYAKADPAYTGRAVVPVLWDKRRETIVNNESSEIIRMLNDAFDAAGATGEDYYPEDLRAEIDAINEPVYEHVNNGVYKSGFAASQAAYDSAVGKLFETLDMLEARLSKQRYLAGERITEADWRLFTTLVRFDPVYHGHFKCNLRRLIDYPNLWAYTRELYQVPGTRETVDFDHIKTHYYWSHAGINPTRIVPFGPVLDFDAPHGR